MSTGCLMPKTKRSDTEEKLTTELEEPITVHTSKLDSRQSRFWRLDEDSESKIESMRNWEPEVTCRGSCTCYPAQALQVCGLSISSKEGSTITTRAYISGFFAIRDHYDRRRIYIFKRERGDPVPIDFINGVGNVRINTPHRGILYGDLIFDYELNISYATSEGDKEEKIEGKALYNGKDRPYSSRPEIIHTSIPINDDSKIKETNLKFIRFTQGIEAQIEIKPPEALNFRLTVRMGNLKDEIALFDGEYSVSSGNADRHPLKFVLVVPFLDTLELKYSGSNHTDEQPKIYPFKSLYHGFSQQDITLKSGIIKMEIKWSRM